MPRVLIWFSCGVTSAVAAKLALSEYPDAEVLRCVIDSEHEDNNRFAADVSKWLSRTIIELRNPKYRTHFDVIRGERYLNGPQGAKCTSELKRKLRDQYSRHDDLHIFGFNAGEEDRVQDFREHFPDLNFDAPLIEAGLSKSDCKAIVQRAGIELPAMYGLGYGHNNCIGCVKGGAGYWNRIRVDFPAAFAEMAALERWLGRTCIRRDSEPVWLDELDPNAGRFDEDQPGECSMFCHIALQRIGV